jgi:aminopeptidase N
VSAALQAQAEGGAADEMELEEGESLDEADHTRKGDFETYLSEVAERYARPIVARKFDAPIDLFDRHLYEKGGLVLHELRCRLGHEDFVASIRNYVAAHAGGTVETVDLARAIEQTTGRNVDRFFDEYVHRAGHPQLKVELTHESDKQRVRVSVKQTQEGDAIALAVPVELVVGDKPSTHSLELKKKEETFFLPATREPSQCVVDPHRDLLATLEVDKPLGWWRTEVQQASVARARTEAAAALSKDTAPATVQALVKTLKAESVFWGTRAACAKALGTLRTPSAREALIELLGKVKHPKARRAIVAALGSFREDEAVAAVLAAHAKKGDASGFVEGELARAIGRVRGKGAFAALESLIDKPAFQDAVRVGALATD